jgi:hypothetical protein
MKEIKLTQGKFAIVDDEDFEELNKYKWYLKKGKKGTFYAQRTKWYPNGQYKKAIMMHREIMKKELTNKKPFTDHINHDGLDNRKNNLRPCTNSQNMANCRQHKDSNSPKGIYWDKERQKWAVQICCNYKKHAIGRFNNLEEAVLAYDIKAKELFENFATPLISQGVVHP